jgi:hypothetical protein
MSAAKARPKAKSAAKGAARSAAKGAARSAAKGAAKAGTKTAKAAASAGGDRIGRGTRWTDAQVSLLLDTVKGSSTAKQAFEVVAKELGKSTGTVQQKYYNLQKATGGGAPRKRGRPAGSTNRATSAPARSSAGTPNASALKTMTVDELVTLAKNVKGEIDRRRSELAAASKLLAG